MFVAVMSTLLVSASATAPSSVSPHAISDTFVPVPPIFKTPCSIVLESPVVVEIVASLIVLVNVVSKSLTFAPLTEVSPCTTWVLVIIEPVTMFFCVVFELATEASFVKVARFWTILASATSAVPDKVLFSIKLVSFSSPPFIFSKAFTVALSTVILFWLIVASDTLFPLILLSVPFWVISVIVAPFENVNSPCESVEAFVLNPSVSGALPLVVSVLSIVLVWVMFSLLTVTAPSFPSILI